MNRGGAACRGSNRRGAEWPQFRPPCCDESREGSIRRHAPFKGVAGRRRAPVHRGASGQMRRSQTASTAERRLERSRLCPLRPPSPARARGDARPPSRPASSGCRTAFGLRQFLCGFAHRGTPHCPTDTTPWWRSENWVEPSLRSVPDRRGAESLL